MESGPILGTMLVWVRIAAALVASPIFSSVPAPLPFKMLLGAFLSLTTTIGLAPGDVDMRRFADQSLPVLVFAEVFIGMVLGFGLQAAFGAFAIAGKVLEIQTGFGLGAAYNPVMRSMSSSLTTSLTLYAALIFFLTDAHHGLVRGLAFSFGQLPLGASLSPSALPVVAAQFGAMFSTAVVLAGPVILGLLLVEAGLSVMSRVMPQMNIMFVGVPVRVFAGLSLLALLAPYLSGVISRTLKLVFVYFEQVAR